MTEPLDIDKIRTCAPLLGNPALDVVLSLCDELEAARKDNERWIADNANLNDRIGQEHDELEAARKRIAALSDDVDHCRHDGSLVMAALVAAREVIDELVNVIELDNTRIAELEGTLGMMRDADVMQAKLEWQNEQLRVKG